MAETPPSPEVSAELLALIDDQWARFATFAFRCYELVGRGAVGVDVFLPQGGGLWVPDALPTGRPARGGYMTVAALQKTGNTGDLDTFRQFADQYDPHGEILFALGDESRSTMTLFIHKTPPGRCPPCASVWTPEHEEE